MSTTTLPTTRVISTERPGVSFPGVLRSELVKLTSLRSTRVAALCVPLLVVAGMLLRAFAYAQTAASTPLDVASPAAWADVLDVGAHAGELAAVVLAALAVGSEYTSRVALATFVAVPRRLHVLAAKTTVVLVLLVALLAVGFLAGAVVALPLMSAAGLGRPMSPTAAAALSELVPVLVCALLALAVTTLARSTAAGITVVLAVLLVLPVVAGLLLRGLGVDLQPFLLTYAAPMAAALHDPDGPAALVRDVVVTVAWVGVPAVTAALALVRRDA